MARKPLGIVLLLIATSGCAGRPWLARHGSNDRTAVIAPSHDDRIATNPSTPGFLPAGYSTPGSPTRGAATPPTQSPYQRLHNQPLHRQPLPGDESPRRQSPSGSSYGQQIAAPPMAAIPGSHSMPFYEGSHPGTLPGFQQYVQQSVVDEVRRQNLTSTPLASSNAIPVAASPSDTETPEGRRAAEFNINDAQAASESTLASTGTLPTDASPTGRSPKGDPGETPRAELQSNPSGSQPANDDPKMLDGQVVHASHTTTENLDPASGRWRDAAANTLATINRELAKNDLSTAERTRLNVMGRLLHAFLNDSEKALAPIEGVDEDESEYWKHFAHSLVIFLDADEKNTSSRRSALTLRSLRVAADHLANISKLDVRNLAFCSKVESYGRFDEFKTYGFKPGQEVLLYVEVENFAVESDSNRHETELQGEYTIFNVDGKRVANAGLPLDKQVSKNRRHDYFIAYRVFMPKRIEQGHYTLQLTIEDLKGSKSNQSTVEFWIR
ncbi:MAG: hypothetical protein CMJ50_06645 [Planctomycetaceae bacterium]|nr:hypothetical protein [Planctomycetaceae bacterium]